MFPYLCRWQHPPNMGWASSIEAGRSLAFKHCRQHRGGGNFLSCRNPDSQRRAGARMGRVCARITYPSADAQQPILCVSSGVHPHSPPHILPLPDADVLGRKALATELRALSTLHRAGCGARVVRPVAVIEWAGQWIEDEHERDRKWYYVSGPIRWVGQQQASRPACVGMHCHTARPEMVAAPWVQVHTQQSHLAFNASPAHACSMQPAQRIR